MSIKMSIKKLENRLGYKIKKNVFCVGFDTATKSGVALIWTNDKEVKIDTDLLKIPTVPDDTEDKSEIYEEKLDLFLNILRDFKRGLYTRTEHNILVMENSFLRMNVWTFGFLKAMMGIVYAELHDLFDEIKIIFPLTARKIIGFTSQLPKKSKGKDKKKEIMKWVSNIVEEKITDDNIADALVLAFAGIKE